MVAHVGRIAQEKRGTVCRGQAECAKVAHTDLSAIRKAARRKVCPQHQRREGIDVDAEQAGLGKALGRGQKIAAGACAGIDDARRRAVGRSPSGHRFDDLSRRVGLPQRAPQFRRVDAAIGRSQGIAAGPDEIPDFGQVGTRRARRVASVDDSRFLGGERVSMLGRQRGRRHDERVASRKNVHATKHLIRLRHFSRS